MKTVNYDSKLGESCFLPTSVEGFIDAKILKSECLDIVISFSSIGTVNSSLFSTYSKYSKTSVGAKLISSNKIQYPFLIAWIKMPSLYLKKKLDLASSNDFS